ncbi:MAG: hypothetical protein M1838_002608 [Thelocarpon superellum]|nr:MAG: hypothetical protein M1838_002608 [Thelocarpon superellum]
MAASGSAVRIFSATYSNVPVYEYSFAGNHVMRRRGDDWINATHILKVADFDKPARTRILEREVQKGVHEKVQGGYGKYQGTWIPLHEGRSLAQRNGVLEKLLPILDYVPGDQSPPQAPKHTTAASSKPKVPKAAAMARRVAMPASSQFGDDQYDNISAQLNDDDTPDNTTIASYDDDDMLQMSQNSTGSRKRKRGMAPAPALSSYDEQHIAYADELLDYFMLASSDPPLLNIKPPTPPENFNVDRAIDEQGHTALHWAAAMGDIAVVRELLNRGATLAKPSSNGETPLMRAVLFTNNYEKSSMPKLIHLLLDTVEATDYFGSTVFHHIAATTSTRSKFLCARYYCDIIANRLSENLSGDDLARILDLQDTHGDTALTIAARCGATKCVRSLVGHGASTQVRNRAGESADELLAQLQRRKRERPMASSSPFQADASGSTRDTLPAERLSSGPHQSEAAQALAATFGPVIMEKSKKLADAFDSELIEKDADLREAKRLRAGMEDELRAVRQEMQRLQTSEQDEQLEAAETERLAGLERETQSLVEHEQRQELQQLLNAEESRVSPASRLQQPQTEDQLQDKLRLVAALHEEQRIRHSLVRDVVHHASLAGKGERHAQYRKLIGSSLSLDENEVENCVPGILAELETAKISDGGGAILQEMPK